MLSMRTLIESMFNANGNDDNHVSDHDVDVSACAADTVGGAGVAENGRTESPDDLADSHTKMSTSSSSISVAPVGTLSAGRCPSPSKQEQEDDENEAPSLCDSSDDED